jgi:hypothetical protein
MNHSRNVPLSCLLNFLQKIKKTAHSSPRAHPLTPHPTRAQKDKTQSSPRAIFPSPKPLLKRTTPLEQTNPIFSSSLFSSYSSSFTHLERKKTKPLHLESFLELSLGSRSDLLSTLEPSSPNSRASQPYPFPRVCSRAVVLPSTSNTEKTKPLEQRLWLLRWVISPPHSRFLEFIGMARDWINYLTRGVFPRFCFPRGDWFP